MLYYQRGKEKSFVTARNLLYRGSTVDGVREFGVMDPRGIQLGTARF